MKSLMVRCFVGDKIDLKLLIPVCNVDREKAIALATEMVRLVLCNLIIPLRLKKQNELIWSNSQENE